MIDFIETHVEFILEFLHVLYPLDGESLFRQAIFPAGEYASD
jgi:hypothetical protein